MKNFTITLFIIFISYKLKAQNSFEGSIKFKTEISANEIDFKNELYEKYGDSVVLFYSKNGNLKRQYLNSSDLGNDYQIYDAEKGLLFMKRKSSLEFTTTDVKVNSIVKLISKKKIKNETIMNLDCECFEYIGISKYNQNVILNYCFNSKTPKVNSTLFEKHTDFFLNEYFKSSERPYLKFSIQTDKFKIVQLATEVLEKEIDIKLFEVK